MSNFCVTKGRLVAHHDNGDLLTWASFLGALRFAAMNGGTVTPVTAAPDGSVKMQPSVTSGANES